MYEESPDPKQFAADYRRGMAFPSLIGLITMDRRFMLETMNQAIKLAELDSPDAFQRARLLANATEKDLHGFPPKVFSRLALPAATSILARFITLEARQRCVLIAVGFAEAIQTPLVRATLVDFSHNGFRD